MPKDSYILGMSGGFSPRSHNGAAVILKNSTIVAAIEEERLIRVKHATGLLPKNAIHFCLSAAGISIREVDYLAYFVNSYSHIAKDIKDYMEFHFGYCPEIKLINHHTAHAASSYFTSGFDEAMILTIDGSGDGISTTLSQGRGNAITRLKEYAKPNSLGIFYAIITQWLGFEMDSDEYKVMGLSSYGKYDSELREKMDQILKIDDRGYRLNDALFIDAPTKQQCKYNEQLINILGAGRKSKDPVTDREKNVAYAAQRQLERACLALLKDLSGLVNSKKLCLAGGTALNCVMNSVLLHSGFVNQVFVPPVAEDSGAALGAALVVAASLGFTFRELETPFLGLCYSNEQIKKDLDMLKLSYVYMEETALLDYITDAIMDGKIIGWFQGKSEYGARALGNRSILADPRNPAMKETINKLIKFREDFRPFAPSVCLKDASRYFAKMAPSPYMTFTFDVTTDKLPAITHVDNTARVQTVTKKDNELYYKLLKKMGGKSGLPVVLNTSLNIMGQPMAGSPKDALAVFGATGLDIIALGNYVVAKPGNEPAQK